MKDWVLGYDGYAPDQEPLREALCTLGNGFLCTRGAAAEAVADGTHYPGTYRACLYDRATTDVQGRTVENEDLVNLPNWLPLEVRVAGGPWFRADDADLLEYRQELDMREGMLRRIIRFRDGHGRVTRLENRRLVSMHLMHAAAQELTLTPENWSGRVEIRAAIDGRVTNDGVARYRDLESRHHEPLEWEATGRDLVVKVRTRQSRVEVAMAARVEVFRDGAAADVERVVQKDVGYAAHRFSLDVDRGRPVSVEKVVAVFTSRDPAVSEAGLEARQWAWRFGRFAELAELHRRQWDLLWRRFDIGLHLTDAEDEEKIRRVLRLHVFHLLQSVSLHSMDLDVGVPSRGWHGEAYRGHIFWDELFIFPFLNLRVPEITRSLLMYRHRRLDEARQAAKKAGYAGAMYPWQSGSDGREESQVVHLNPRSGRWIPDNSRLQRHVNAAIAYNVWQYYSVTGDMEFLCYYGSEMLLEIARFWASLVTLNEASGRYEIRGVMGPDEYHEDYPGREGEGLDNNAYTNVMAAWVLHRAVELLELLPGGRCRDVCEEIGLDEAEVQRWKEIGRRMTIPFHGDGIISQFEGYEELEEFDWDGYRERYGDIQRLDRILEQEDDSPNRYKASKQADVLMLFFLFTAEELRDIFDRLGYELDGDAIPRNIEYYVARTSHGSSLSRVVHARVLARLDRAGSWTLFKEALLSDLEDIQGGTTPEGIHLGAMAGTVDMIQRGYPELVGLGDEIRLAPVLPEELERLDFHLRYRGRSLRFELTDSCVKVEFLPSATATPIAITAWGTTAEVGPGASEEIRA